MEEIAILQMNDLIQNDFKTNFYANTIPNHLKDNHKHIEKPHKHNFYVSILFTRGTGTHDIDFNRYEVKAGTVFMLSPTQTHSWSLSEDIDGYIFFHSQEFLDIHFITDSIRDYPVFKSSIYPNALYLDTESVDMLEPLLKAMLSEVSDTNWKRNQLLVNLTSQFYIYTNRLLLAEEIYSKLISHQYSTHFLHFESLLEKHFVNEKSASFYADKLNMTQKHLNRICKTIANLTTTDIIINRTLLEAKRILIHSDKSLAEIASTLGYDDYSYFSRVFKNKVGETPKAFVKRLR